MYGTRNGLDSFICATTFRAKGDLGNFELAKLGEVANLRSDMLALFDKLVDVSAQAVLAAWLRTIDRNELHRQLIESPDKTFEVIMSEARARIRDGQRNEEELLLPRRSLPPGAAKEALLRVMPDSQAKAMTAHDLFQTAQIGRRVTGYKALQKLLAADRIQRIRRRPGRYLK